MGAQWTQHLKLVIILLSTKFPILLNTLLEILFWFLNKFFSDYGSWYLIGLGLLAIVVTLFFRDGLWGALHRRYGLSLFPTHRFLKQRN